MKVFICVYRHFEPKLKKNKEIKKAAEKREILNLFFDTYFDENNFYDWGDDPSFFAAKNYLGNENKATWGVCRSNVRRQLEEGDVVVFICAKEKNKYWDYYYMGYGTVDERLFDRTQIWKNDKYENYRNFFNILVDQNNEHLEPFGGKHDDYDRRIKAPYIFFKNDEKLTNINFTNPLHIAYCDTRVSPFETWYSNINSLVSEVEMILLKKYSLKRRYIRSSHKQISHPHIKLDNLSNENQKKILQELFQVSEKIKTK